MEPQNSTIVKLSPSSKLVGVATFEEAFGEHSELRGKGRARRQEKKITKIANRGKRKSARQDVRSQQQEARQTRKDTRKTRRLDRKSLSEDTAPEEEMEEIIEQEESPENSYSEYDPETEEEYDEYDEYDEGGESFDGEYNGADGNQPRNVTPQIADLTKRHVWHKESVRRHSLDKNKIQSQYALVGKDIREARNQSARRSEIDSINMKIQQHEARIVEIGDALKQFGSHPHIQLGYKLARTNLEKQNEKRNVGRDQEKVKATIVAKGLNPEIGPNRIAVAPQNSVREVTMGADGDVIGKVKQMPVVTKVVIVVALAAGAYYLAKKYKLI